MATTAARKKHRDALDRDGHSGRHANTESWRGRRESLRDTVSDEQLERMICLMEGLAGQVMPTEPPVVVNLIFCLMFRPDRVSKVY